MRPELDIPDLPRRIRERDPQALTAVVEAYLGQVLRAARGAGLRGPEAEELTQATFTTFLETAHRFEGRSKVRTWIFGILYRKLAETRRGLAKDRRSDDIDQVVESRFRQDGSWSRPPRAADAELAGKEMAREIGDCMEAAPERQRLAFMMREVEGLSTGEICKILEISDTNLGVMLYRIRNRLRECLEAKGVAA